MGRLAGLPRLDLLLDDASLFAGETLTLLVPVSLGATGLSLAVFIKLFAGETLPLLVAVSFMATGLSLAVFVILDFLASGISFAEGNGFSTFLFLKAAGSPRVRSPLSCLVFHSAIQEQH